MSNYNHELTIITKTKKLAEYIFTITDKSPKKFRFTFVARMQNQALDIMENLLRANEIYFGSGSSSENRKRRVQYQEEAMVGIKILGYISMISREQGCILPKQFEQIALQLSECRKLLGAWMKSDRERMP